MRLLYLVQPGARNEEVPFKTGRILIFQRTISHTAIHLGMLLHNLSLSSGLVSNLIQASSFVPEDTVWTCPEHHSAQ